MRRTQAVFIMESLHRMLKKAWLFTNRPARTLFVDIDRAYNDPQSPAMTDLCRRVNIRADIQLGCPDNLVHAKGPNNAFDIERIETAAMEIKQR